MHTDTHSFYTVAWSGGSFKVFWFSNHHERALAWLGLQEI